MYFGKKQQCKQKELLVKLEFTNLPTQSVNQILPLPLPPKAPPGLRPGLKKNVENSPYLEELKKKLASRVIEFGKKKIRSELKYLMSF